MELTLRFIIHWGCQKGKHDSLSPTSDQRNFNSVPSYAPPRLPHAAGREHESEEIRSTKSVTFKTDQVQVWLGQDRLGQIRLDYIRLGQVRLGQVRLDYIKLDQIRLDQVRLSQLRLDQIKLGQAIQTTLSSQLITLLMCRVTLRQRAEERGPRRRLNPTTQFFRFEYYSRQICFSNIYTYIYSKNS